MPHPFIALGRPLLTLQMYDNVGLCLSKYTSKEGTVSLICAPHMKTGVQSDSVNEDRHE